MSTPGDLTIFEAIRDAGDEGLTSGEVAERFGMAFWDAHDACLRLKQGKLVTDRPRKTSALIAFVALPDAPAIPPPPAPGGKVGPWT